MDEAVKSSVERQLRVARHVKKENEEVARKLEKSESRSAKNGRREEERVRREWGRKQGSEEGWCKNIRLREDTRVGAETQASSGY